MSELLKRQPKEAQTSLRILIASALLYLAACSPIAPEPEPLPTPAPESFPPAKTDQENTCWSRYRLEDIVDILIKTGGNSYKITLGDPISLPAQVDTDFTFPPQLYQTNIEPFTLYPPQVDQSTLAYVFRIAGQIWRFTPLFVHQDGSTFPIATTPLVQIDIVGAKPSNPGICLTSTGIIL